VHCGVAAAAARDAGYRPRSARKQGWRLLRSPVIRARIRAIQAALGNHRDRDREALMGKLEVVYVRALEDHQFTRRPGPRTCRRRWRASPWAPRRWTRTRRRR